MSKNTEILKAFYTAFENHDWTATRALLQDDFHFRGPTQQADSADAFIAINQQINPDLKFSDVKMIEDGDIIMSFFTSTMTRPAQGANRCAEYVQIEGGKIKSIELIYDSAGFH